MLTVNRSHGAKTQSAHNNCLYSYCCFLYFIRIDFRCSVSPSDNGTEGNFRYNTCNIHGDYLVDRGGIDW